MRLAVKVAIPVISGTIIFLTGFSAIWFSIKNIYIHSRTSNSPPLNFDSIIEQRFLNETKNASCGVRLSLFKTESLRIINGYNADRNSWPWIVSLRIYYKYSNTYSGHYCAGTLINGETVLTAAHCVADQPNNNIAVIVGINSIKETLSSSNTYFPSKIIYHPKYNGTLIINDIALIKLSRPINLSFKSYPVCLPKSLEGNYVFNKELTLIGWGSIDGMKSQSSLAHDLQETKLKIINGNYICSTYVTYDTNNIYCALDPYFSLTSNACYGDSGGPLLYLVNDRWVIFGITSFVLSNSRGDCNPQMPSYYTQVASYMNWIEETLKNLQ